MKAKEVLKELNITRPTLTKYVKQGLVKVDSNINGQYNYNEESVYKLKSGNVDNWNNSVTITIPPLEATITDTKNDLVVSALTDITDVLNQLSAMRLLTPDSLRKLDNIKNTINKLDKLYKIN